MTERPLPSFLIIGAQKSATRWLRSNLGKHPEIYTAPRELHFWNVEQRVRNAGLDWYRARFEEWDGQSIVGEATPGYMIWRHHPSRVAERIHSALPDVKLVAILRNPIERANSAMLHHIRRQRLPAGVRLVDVVRERAPVEKDRLCLVTGGWYAASLERYQELFGDRLLVLLHDDVQADPTGVYATALEHVDASPGFVPDEISKRVFSNRRGRLARGYDLTVDEREEMWAYFRADVERLQSMFDLDLSRWEPGAEPAEPDDLSSTGRGAWLGRLRRTFGSPRREPRASTG